MKWIVNLLSEKSISRDRAMNVRGLQRYDDVGEVKVFEDPDMPQCRLDHRFGRCRPILLQKIFFQRAPVNTNPNWYFLGLGRAHDFDDAFVLPNVSWI